MTESEFIQSHSSYDFLWTTDKVEVGDIVEYWDSMSARPIRAMIIGILTGNTLLVKENIIQRQVNVGNTIIYKCRSGVTWGTKCECGLQNNPELASLPYTAHSRWCPMGEGDKY
jgi:hypothetical protein